MLHRFTFPLLLLRRRRRLPQRHLPCPRKIKITPACRFVFAAAVRCVLEGPSAHSHCLLSSDLEVQTVQRDHFFSALVLGRPESVPLQMQAVCTSFSCQFQILFVSAKRSPNSNGTTRTHLLTTLLPVEWQSDVCAALW